MRTPGPGGGPAAAAWRAGCCVVLLAAASCGEQRGGPAPAQWAEAGPGYRSRPLADPGHRSPGFTPMAPRRTGISFANAVSDSAALHNQLLTHGAGVAIGDVDGDGLPDLYFARTEGPNALYRNLGGWRFEDITDWAGVALNDRFSTGVVLADVDGDGDLDLLVNALGGPNALLLNDGTGRFTEDTTYPGRQSRAGATTGTLADVDGDGSLDLYIATYKAYTTVDLYSPQERAFDQVVRRTGPRSFEVIEKFRRDYKVVLRDDLQGVVLAQRADPDQFYRNDGRGGFTEVPIARSERFVDEEGRRFDEAPDNFTLAARFYDVNGDLAPDLYVANDFEDPDQFWLNDGRGFFRLAPALMQRTMSNAAMAVDFGDVNRDGHVDFFAADMLSLDRRALRTQIPTHTALPKQPGVIADRPQLQRNTLFLNRGDGSFAQIAELAGVDASGWTWSTMFLDVDLDGYEDLLTANGYTWDFMDADTQERFRNRLIGLDWREQRMTTPPLAVPNYAFRNRGDLTFEEVSGRWRFSGGGAGGPDISHGMAAGDLDGDGDLDVVINRLGAPALVLRNDAAAPRVAVRLAGSPPNTQGIGAKVRVLGGAVPFQERELTAGGLYLSSSAPEGSFATGPADSVRLEVRWRDGRRSVVEGARPGRLYEIHQAGAGSDGAAAGEQGGRGEGPGASAAAAPSAPPLFVDRTAWLGHTHHEPVFDDAARQLLLPNSFAQLGPGVTWYDLDGDGREELLIGGARDGAPAAYRYTGTRFTAWPLGLPPLAGDQTTLLVVPDGAGGSVLLVGLANYEADSLPQALALPSVLGLPLDARGRPRGAPAAAVPGDTASVGPLALADYDGDGDLDLFVGSRILAGAYPLSPSSRLYRNDGRGRFVLDTANSALLRHLGMVTSALFADVTGNGSPDLVLAIEWGPLKLFRNDGQGRFAPAPASWGLDHIYSRWMGLTSADVDQDGRLDLLTTSWGRNTRPTADRTRPLYLYFGHFDPARPGPTLDLLLAQAEPRLSAHGRGGRGGRGGRAGDVLAPLASFARLSRAVPAIAQRLRTFHAYADATVEEVLGPAAPQALRLGINSLDHLVWRNRGDSFAPAPLPLQAQFAPATTPVVGDFDGDGIDDLVLSQNFFPTDLNTPRYDAGRALLLTGDGQGGFTPVPGPQSGLLVYGDQRGAAAADFDQDGRLDLVITQNGTTTRLFHNQGATPGLRVRLQGPPGNPYAIGAQLRLVSGPRRGPLRELHAGHGHWSSSSLTPLLGRQRPHDTLEVRWPDRHRSRHPVPPGARAITVRP